MMTGLDKLNDREVLILTVYGEARGEPIEGIVAVANVIKNRVNSERKTYTEICLAPEQFSCWNENDPNYQVIQSIIDKILNDSLTEPYYLQCQSVSNSVFYGFILDNTKGALNYVTKALFNSPKCPSWAKNMKNQIVIGSQVYGMAI